MSVLAQNELAAALQCSCSVVRDAISSAIVAECPSETPELVETRDVFSSPSARQRLGSPLLWAVAGQQSMQR